MRAELCHRSQQCFRYTQIIIWAAAYCPLWPHQRNVCLTSQGDQQMCLCFQPSIILVCHYDHQNPIYIVHPGSSKYIPTKHTAEWDVSQTSYYKNTCKLLMRVDEMNFYTLTMYSLCPQGKLAENTDDSSYTKQIIVQSHALQNEYSSP